MFFRILLVTLVFLNPFINIEGVYAAGEFKDLTAGTYVGTIENYAGTGKPKNFTVVLEPDLNGNLVLNNEKSTIPVKDTYDEILPRELTFKNANGSEMTLDLTSRQRIDEVSGVVKVDGQGNINSTAVTKTTPPSDVVTVPTSPTPSQNSTSNTSGGLSYTLLAPIKTFFPSGSVNISDGGLGVYLNNMYRIGIAAATGLALVMIVVGGLQYVSTDSIQGKSDGKGRIQDALIGLLLALTSYIILNQINPNLLRSELKVAATNSTGRVNTVDVQLVEGGGTPRTIPAGQPGSYVLANTQNPTPGSVWGGYTNLKQLLNSIPNGSRSTDGSLIFTNYWNGDTNTNQQRGNNCNLLVSGSVALSPDLIRTYKPKKGSSVIVNGLVVGYFDDTTGETTQGYVGGTLIRNTIDIYDPNKSLGSILKKMPPGSWTLSFGGVRQQKANPCP